MPAVREPKMRRVLVDSVVMETDRSAHLTAARPPCDRRRMSVKTIVVTGTRGPCHRAVLSLVSRHTSVAGLPDVLVVSSSPGTDYLVVTADARLVSYLSDELRAAFDRVRRLGPAAADWPGGGDPPSSCEVKTP